MLVLTRKSNQSIMIGDDIEVSVLSIMGEKVRIGIQAPRDIPVFRKEVYLEIQQERGRELAASGARTEVDAARHGGGAGGRGRPPRRPGGSREVCEQQHRGVRTAGVRVLPLTLR
jgi:carbon storage regulator